MEPPPKRRPPRFSRAGYQALIEWRLMPDAPDPARNQHSSAELVPQLMARLGLAESFRQEELAAAWKDIAGEVAARFSHPARVRNKVLYVSVSQSSVQWTLDRMKPELLRRLAARFGPDAFRELRFQP